MPRRRVGFRAGPALLRRPGRGGVEAGVGEAVGLRFAVAGRGRPAAAKLSTKVLHCFTRRFEKNVGPWSAVYVPIFCKFEPIIFLCSALFEIYKITLMI